MLCPKCGTNNPEDALFCRQCGAKMAPEVTEKQAGVDDKIDQVIQEETNQEQIDANVINDAKKTNQIKVSNKPSNPKTKKMFLAGVMVIAIALCVGIFVLTRPKNIDFTKGLNVEITGYNNYGTLSVARPMNELGFEVYTNAQTKVIQKYNERVLRIKNLLPLYYSDLIALTEINENYDPSGLNNLTVYNIEDIVYPSVDGLSKNDKDFELVKEAALYGNADQGINLYHCEFIFPQEKENGMLSNGDQVVYKCQVSAYAQDVLKIKGDHEIIIAIDGLAEGSVVNLDDVVQINYKVELAGYDGFRIKPEVTIDSASLPQGVTLLDDVTIETKTMGNTISIQAQANREGIIFTSGHEQCHGENQCAYEFEGDRPQVIEYEFFNAPSACQNYELISNTVYKVVNTYFDNIGWQVYDENGNVHTVLNYELLKYSNGNYNGRVVDFKVNGTDGEVYTLRLFGVLVDNDGQSEFVTDPSQGLSGKVSQSGAIY